MIKKGKASATLYLIIFLGL